MDEKLTEAQRRVLGVLGDRQDDLWVNYGGGCGVRRSTVRALERLGLAQYARSETGVSARITDAGRTALATGGGREG